MEEPLSMKRMFISFKSLMMSMLAVFLAFAMFITLLMSWQYIQRMWERQSDTTLASFSVATNQIYNLLNSAMKTAASAQQEEGVDEYLWGTFYSDLTRVRARQEMWSAIAGAMSKNSALQGLFFLKSDGTLHGYSTPWAFLKEGDSHPIAQNEQIVNAGKNGNVTWIAPFQLRDLTREKSTPINMENVLVLGAVQNRYMLSYGEIPTVLTTLAAVNIETLCDCFNYLSTPEESVYLVNENGECIVATGGMWKQGVIDCWPCVDVESFTGSVKWNSQEKGLQYVVYHQVPSTGWYLVKTTPAYLYEHDILQLRRTTLLISIGLVLIMLLIFMIWARKMTKSLNKINRAMEKMQDGDLSVRILEPLNIREYEMIRRQFNHMADNVEQLMQQTKAMEYERVTLEATALRTQLSPHMIFNSISAIRWTASMLQAEPVAKMLGALAELLRPVFREWRLIWTLREELEHLENYIVLLQLRSGGKLDLQMDFPEELREREVPCFVIQPILENSFEHGLQNSESIVVRIHAYLDGADVLCIQVQDNGGGIQPDRLEELRRALEESDEDNKPRGIGLYNVHRKIRLLFGRNSGVLIDSRDDVTCIVLRIEHNVK